MSYTPSNDGEPPRFLTTGWGWVAEMWDAWRDMQAKGEVGERSGLGWRVFGTESEGSPTVYRLGLEVEFVATREPQ